MSRKIPARPSSRAGRSALLRSVSAVVALWITGCAAHPLKPNHIDPKFYGTWVNTNPRYFNWWNIQADRVVNYGIALDNGKCSANAAIIMGTDKIDVTWGNSGTVQLAMAGEELVFQAPGISAHHKRSSHEAICRRPDGSYFENAPYPNAK
jgi:hypothetical protein